MKVILLGPVVGIVCARPVVQANKPTSAADSTIHPLGVRAFAPSICILA